MYSLVFTTLGKISYFPLALNASSTYASWHHNMPGQKAYSAFAVAFSGDFTSHPQSCKDIHLAALPKHKRQHTGEN